VFSRNPALHLAVSRRSSAASSQICRCDRRGYRSNSSCGRPTVKCRGVQPFFRWPKLMSVDKAGIYEAAVEGHDRVARFTCVVASVAHR
jgi:hypothetical protein